MPRKAKEKQHPIDNLGSIFNQVAEKFKLFVCDKDRCEEEGVVIHIKKENPILDFKLLCMDKGEQVHRCDCVVFGVKRRNNKCELFAAVIELKSAIDNAHPLRQIEACEDILNRIDQVFCSQYMNNGSYYPIIIKKRIKNSMIYKMIVNTRANFNGKEELIIIKQSGISLAKIIKLRDSQRKKARKMSKAKR